MFSKAQLVGRVGRDLELRTANEKSFGTFALATTHTFKNADGNKVEETTWHRIVLAGRMAENVAKFCGKGSIVAVSGRIRNRKFTNKEQQEVTVTEIVADEVAFVDVKKPGATAENQAPAPAQAHSPAPASAPAQAPASAPAQPAATQTPQTTTPEFVDDGEPWSDIPF